MTISQDPPQRHRMTPERRAAIRLLYPNTVFVPLALLDWYELTLQPQLRFRDNKIFDLGHENLVFRFFVITADESHVGGAFLPSRFLSWCEDRDAPFDVTVDASYEL